MSILLISSGGPPLGINPSNRPTQDSLITKYKDQDIPSARGHRDFSFEGSFHECEISSTLLRSPSEDGSTLLSMDGPTDVTYIDRTMVGNRENPSQRDFPQIVQNSYEDGIVIHLISDCTIDDTSVTVDDNIETVYQNVKETETKDLEFDANVDEEKAQMDDMVEPVVSAEEPSNPFDVKEADTKDVEEDIFKVKESPDEPCKTPKDNGQTTAQEGAVEQAKTTDIREDDRSEKNPQRIHGNSLGAISGWSSEFQNQHSPETPSKDEGSLTTSISRSKSVLHIFSYNHRFLKSFAHSVL